MPKIVYEPNSTKSAKEFAKVQLKKYKLKTVCAAVRKNNNWEYVGTYPLFCSVIDAALDMGISVSRKDIIAVLRLDPEFKNIKTKSEIVDAVYESCSGFRIPAIQAQVKPQKAARDRHSAVSDTLVVSTILRAISNRNEVKMNVE